MALRLHIDIGHGASRHLYAVAQERPVERHVVERSEEVFVVHVELSANRICERCPDVLVEITHLVCVGMCHAVGVEQAVTVEVVVAGGVTSVVASVGVDVLSLFVLSVQALVYKVPNETALELRILTHQVPVLGKSALGVAHGVGVFAEDERLLAVALSIVLAGLVGQVHLAVNICAAFLNGTFVVHGARRVVSLHHVVSLLHVYAVTALVAETPTDYTGMVLQYVRVVDVAFEVSLLKLGNLRQRLLAITHAMRFEVCLSHYVEAIFVAEVVPTRIVRIVAGAHGIDVVLLHRANVLHHPFRTYHIASVRVHLVAVCALDKDGLSVHEKLGVLYLNFAETHTLLQALHHAIAVFQVHTQSVEVGRFGCPLRRVVYAPFRVDVLREGQRLRLDRRSLAVEQREVNRLALALLALNAYAERTVCVVVNKVGRYEEVGNVALRTGVEVNFAGNAGEPPKVLVFEIGTVAPTHHLHGHEVLLACCEVRS